MYSRSVTVTLSTNITMRFHRWGTLCFSYHRDVRPQRRRTHPQHQQPCANNVHYFAIISALWYVSMPNTGIDLVRYEWSNIKVPWGWIYVSLKKGDWQLMGGTCMPQDFLWGLSTRPICSTQDPHCALLKMITDENWNQWMKMDVQPDKSRWYLQFYCHLRWYIFQISTHCMQHTTTQQIKVVWEILCLNSICQLLIALQISLAWSVLDNYRDVHSTDKFYISARQSVNSN